MSAIDKYTKPAVVLHWLIAVLMMVNVCLGLVADDMPDAWVRFTINLHKSIGITVLGLAILRLLWRLGHRPPALSVDYARWEHVLASIAHWALYAILFALPISGWMHDSAWKDADTHPLTLFGVLPWFRLGFIASLEPVTKESLHSLLGIIHTGLGYTLYVVLGAHVAGALKHQIIDKKAELQRMWF